MHTLAQHLQHLELRAISEQDQAFLQILYATTRDDLRQLPGSAALINMQYDLQTRGFRQQFPDAMHAILERQGVAVGRIIVNFAATEIRLVDISFLPQARRQGFGRAVLQALQHSAKVRNLPLALRVSRGNPHAKRLYLALGFQVCADDSVAEQMIWRQNTEARAEVDA